MELPSYQTVAAIILCHRDSLGLERIDQVETALLGQGEANLNVVVTVNQVQRLLPAIRQLVNAGIKTATSSLLWHLEQIGEPVPQVGACGIVADGAGTPICILELTEVEIRPFNAVDAQFARMVNPIAALRLS